MSKNENESRIKISTSDVLSIIAIVISLFSFHYSSRQTKLQEKQYVSQIKENQPVFQVDYSVDRLGVKDDDSYDTEVLQIRNIGREVLEVSIESKTFIGYGLNRSRTVYIPITGYFEVKQIGGLVGDIWEEYVPGNIESLLLRRIDIAQSAPYGLMYGFSFIRFVVIHFTDIYNEKHTLYFKNGNQCSKEIYDHIVQESKDVFLFTDFDIKEFKPKDLQFYISRVDSSFVFKEPVGL